MDGVSRPSVCMCVCICVCMCVCMYNDVSILVVAILYILHDDVMMNDD